MEGAVADDGRGAGHAERLVVRDVHVVQHVERIVLRLLGRFVLRKRVWRRRRVRRVRQLEAHDRVGLGWRPELAAGILAQLGAIDVLEVIADDVFDAPASRLRALRSLGAERPVVLHGVGMGLAATAPVAPRRLERMARVVDAVRPAFWSEHLAFVRAGGFEIGHLAAPPRVAATVEGLARNVARARSVVGAAPALENVATLVEPAGSAMDEAEWTAAALEASGADLLLDLHNLHANAVNFGFDAGGFLDRLPLQRVRAVHLAGGREVHAHGPAGTLTRRLLDDHLHDVPDPVYTLLEELARRCAQPLTVVLERDGAYPPMAELVAQLEQARAALRRGRARPRAAGPPAPAPALRTGAPLPEALLARLYVDPMLLREVVRDAHGTARRLGLTAEQADSLAAVDPAALDLAARSFAHKRGAHGRGAGGPRQGPGGSV
jgi:uncharacterized protein